MRFRTISLKPTKWSPRPLEDDMKPNKPIESLILTLRGQKVILDADLAELYGVPTKVFNQLQTMIEITPVAQAVLKRSSSGSSGGPKKTEN